MTEDEFEALWRKPGMPSNRDGGDVCIEKWPDGWLPYRLLPFSAAEDFLFFINDYDANSEDGYLWHGRCRGENLFNSFPSVDNYVKLSSPNKICVRQIGHDFISSVSAWARWFYLDYSDSKVLFGLSDGHSRKRIDLWASVDWAPISDCCRGVEEEIYPGWYNKSDAVIEPKKFISDILYAVKHKYQYQFERAWTFFITTAKGEIFPIKTWEDFQKQLRQYSNIQVQTRLLNTNGADFQFEVKYSYCGGDAVLYGVGDSGLWAKDFLRNCVGYHGEIKDFDTTNFFTLPLPIVKPEIVREY